MSQKGVCAKELSNSSSVWSRPSIHFSWQSIAPASSSPAASLSHGIWNICTARPSCSRWVYYFGRSAGKINCFVTMFILTAAQIKAIGNHSPSLQCFPGQWTVCSHTILTRWSCATADAKSWSVLRRVCYRLLVLRNLWPTCPPSLLLSAEICPSHSLCKLLIRNASAKIRW